MCFCGIAIFSQHVVAPWGLVSVSASQSVSCRAHFRMDQHHHDHSQLRVQKSVKELYCFMEWYEILKTVKSKIYNFKHFLLSKHNPRGTIVVQCSVLSKKYFYPQVCHIPFWQTNFDFAKCKTCFETFETKFSVILFAMPLLTFHFHNVSVDVYFKMYI